MIYCDNIEQQTENNTDYRRVIFTGPKIQIVLMTLQPHEEIGLEAHNNGDQFFRIEQGFGMIEYGMTKTSLKRVNVQSGFGIAIPQGMLHNVKNTSSSELLKLYTIYSPPQHKPDTIVHHKINNNHHDNHDEQHFDGHNDVDYYAKYQYYKKLYINAKNNL